MDKILNFFGIERIIISEEMDNTLRNLSVKDHNYDVKYNVTDDELDLLNMFGPHDDEEDIKTYNLYIKKHLFNRIVSVHNKFLSGFIMMNLMLVLSIIFYFNIIPIIIMVLFGIYSFVYKRKLKIRLTDYNFSESWDNMIEKIDDDLKKEKYNL